MAVNGETEAVPFPARKAMQEAIWGDCIAPADNEWTTWTDAIGLAECAAEALTKAGWKVVPLDAAPSDQGFAEGDYELAALAITEGMRLHGVRMREAGSSEWKALLTPTEFADRCIEAAKSLAATRRASVSGRKETS